MAGNTKKTDKRVKGYTITVKGRPNYSGVGAGGVQFAYGKATVAGGSIVDWYREHDGYQVEEIVDDEPDPATGEETNT